jgi:hypothetical protein
VDPVSWWFLGLVGIVTAILAVWWLIVEFLMIRHKPAPRTILLPPEPPHDLFDPQTWPPPWENVAPPYVTYMPGDKITFTGGPWAGTYTITQVEPADAKAN